MHIFLYQFLPCARALAKGTVRLLAITGALYVSEIPGFYDPFIHSLHPYQLHTENNFICCRSKYVVVVMQSEKTLLFIMLMLCSSPHSLLDVVPKER
jgi:hypothetical protein